MRLGDVQQKILLLLLGGLALGCSASPTQSFKVLRIMKKGWDELDQKNLKRSLLILYQRQLITEQKNPDGSVSLVLTKAGKHEATFSQLFNIKIKKPKRWDKLWRVVLFDIPEKHRKFRDIFRSHLRTIGFHELQHSVFIFPFPCKNEILALVKLYHAESFVRFITAQDIDNELKLRKKFFL